MKKSLFQSSGKTVDALMEGIPTAKDVLGPTTKVSTSPSMVTSTETATTAAAKQI